VEQKEQALSTRSLHAKIICLSKLTKPIPVLNVDGTKNMGGSICRYLKVVMEVQNKTCHLTLLETSLGQEMVILGYPWLKQENPNIDREKQTLTWTRNESYNINVIKTSYDDINFPLVIAVIHATSKEEVSDAWVTSRMSHSQQFAYQADKDKEVKSKEDMIPKSLHKYLKTVFSEREVGKLPIQRPYDHAIDLMPDFIPKQGKVYNMKPQESQMLKEYIKENLTKGLIRKSISPQAVPCFFIPKKNSKTRLVQDY
jgi:hypothetical protein